MLHKSTGVAVPVLVITIKYQLSPNRSIGRVEYISLGISVIEPGIFCHREPIVTPTNGR